MLTIWLRRATSGHSVSAECVCGQHFHHPGDGVKKSLGTARTSARPLSRQGRGARLKVAAGHDWQRIFLAPDKLVVVSS
jgi:hypothetical protein